MNDNQTMLMIEEDYTNVKTEKDESNFGQTFINKESQFGE